MVSDLTLESLIHYEFIFYKWFKIIVWFHFLHMSFLFFQHHLLKRPFLHHCIFLSPLSYVNCPHRLIAFASGHK